MWGDWITDDPNELTQAQKETTINQARLIAGIGAAFAGEDVNVAADMAAEAVRWNNSNSFGGCIACIDDLVRQEARKYSENLKKLSKMSEDYRESDRTLMNQVAELYSKGNIQIAEKYLDELDKSLSSWVAANPKNEKVAAAVAAVIYAVNVAVVPTHVVKIIPIGKVTKLTKAKSAIESTSTYKTFAAKSACPTSTVCFTAGTLIETKEGLKAIETFTGGELIWTRNDITLEYGYRPVIATKATPDQPIFQVTVKNHQGDIETLQTTAEHPFWIKDTGWLKASLLEQGMIPVVLIASIKHLESSCSKPLSRLRVLKHLNEIF
ncbi:polymorphic toxin-type HINT domain-containing protein [Moraxella bovoculi]|uniref:polymorphic toxin-type HINT domain-containing protein n=1 Tax=Moraxella bovoculi TaxID=386891 RepID=UPI003F4FF55C